MSYEVWSVNGYGICTDDIKNVTTPRLMRLINEAPCFACDFLEWAEDNNGEGASINEADVSELLDWEDEFGYTGLAPILHDVILEREGIALTVTDGAGGDNYLLFTPRYPWSPLTLMEMNLTEENIRNIFAKYVQILTDEPVKITYYDVPNGG